jgi:hypothetical protein
MELSPGSVKVPPSVAAAAEPEDPLDDAWEEAYAMVEGYYSALRIRNRLLLSRIIALILRRAARQLPNEPHRKPAELAMQEALNVVADWFQRVLAIELPEQRLAARGRLALLLADMPGRWQKWFLRDADWPEEFVAKMRSSYLAAGPAFKERTMTPQRLDLPAVVTVANKGWEAIGQRAGMRTLVAVMFWGAIAAAIGLLLWG